MKKKSSLFGGKLRHKKRARGRESGAYEASMEKIISYFAKNRERKREEFA